MYIGKLQGVADRIAPWFLRGPNAGRFLQAMGLVLDGELEGFGQAMRLPHPLRCDPSALPVIASDRTLPIYPTEPEASQRARLARWWQLHRQSGTHQGEMRNLQPYFLPDSPVIRTVFQRGDGASATWGTLDASGNYSVYVKSPSNWDYDGKGNWHDVATIVSATNANPIVVTTGAAHGLVSAQRPKVTGVLGNTAANGIRQVKVLSQTTFSLDVAGSGSYTSGGTVQVTHWSRFWVIVYLPFAATSIAYDDGSRYDEATSVYDIALSTQGALDMIALIESWKSAHSAMWGFIVTDDATLFDPAADPVTMPDGWTTLPLAGNWGVPMSPAGVYTRPPAATWLADRGVPA